ncbi:MAG: AAA family ATPase [Streptosporangiales bacterium]|nr:AAA family ATPase [Streptosporangiales bacterium]
MGTSPAQFEGIEQPGLSVRALLPDDGWDERWDGIVVDDEMKARLLSFGLFCLTRRSSVSWVRFPVHGLALLAGPPGTGKTTLAHGLANRIARTLVDHGLAENALFGVVDPHAFPSEFLGESQRTVARLFAETLPDLAARGLPLIVLLDEVEALAVNRSRASFETNPVDVHRATNAVLTGVDHVAAEHDNVLLIATTNEEREIDQAFLSRVDLREQFELPQPAAIEAMLVDTLAEIGVRVDGQAGRLAAVAERCASHSLDARQVRKLVLRAIVSNGPELALAPDRIDVDHLWEVVE